MDDGPGRGFDRAGRLGHAIVRALVAGEAGSNGQGEMQGMLTAVEGLTAFAAPLTAAGLFFAFTSSVLPVAPPGAPFPLAAASALVACLLLRERSPRP